MSFAHFKFWLLAHIRLQFCCIAVDVTCTHEVYLWLRGTRATFASMLLSIGLVCTYRWLKTLTLSRQKPMTGKEPWFSISVSAGGIEVPSWGSSCVGVWSMDLKSCLCRREYSVARCHNKWNHCIILSTLLEYHAMNNRSSVNCSSAVFNAQLKLSYTLSHNLKFWCRCPDFFLYYFVFNAFACLCHVRWTESLAALFAFVSILNVMRASCK